MRPFENGRPVDGCLPQENNLNQGSKVARSQENEWVGHAQVVKSGSRTFQILNEVLIVKNLKRTSSDTAAT